MPENRKSIVVRVEPKFHQKLKLYAISKGFTIQEYVLELIKNDLIKEDKKT